MRLILWIVAIALSAGIIWGALQQRSQSPEPVPGASEQEMTAEVLADEVDTLNLIRGRMLDRAREYDSYLLYQLGNDGFVRRWRDRSAHPLRVYYHVETSTDPSQIRAAKRAFNRWRAIAHAGIPIVFQEVRSEGQADVEVRWYSKLPENRAGRANVVYSGEGWMQSAELALAWRTEQGVLIPEDALYTVALHEIGHLIGLGHSDQPADVMYPTTSVHDLTARDRNTAWLLYQMPPGLISLDLLP